MFQPKWKAITVVLFVEIVYGLHLITHERYGFPKQSFGAMIFPNRVWEQSGKCVLPIKKKVQGSIG